MLFLNGKKTLMRYFEITLRRSKNI